MNLTHAQFNETIRTGRPGQAIGPYSVGEKVFQTQTGIDFGGAHSRNLKSYLFAPNTVFRIGLNKNFEINSAWEFRQEYSKLNTIEYSKYGLSKATVGMRFNITEAQNRQPAIGFQFTLKLPVLSNDYSTKYLAPAFLLIASENLSDRFVLTANAGADFNRDNGAPTGIYVLNMAWSINSKLATFLENYGNYDGHFFENRWDTGLAYLSTDNLQLDLYGGAGSNHGTTDYFVSLGFSYRVWTHRNRQQPNKTF